MSNRDIKRPVSSRTKLPLAANTNPAAVSVNPLVDTCYDYTAVSLTLQIAEELIEEFPPLPISPSQPPALKKTPMCSKAENVDVVEALSQLKNKRMDVKEAANEDLRKISDICQAVLPEYKNSLRDTIDIVHRVCPMWPNTTRPRAIIIQFISRVTRDALWKAAKASPYLKENCDLKFAEDLSKEDQECRSKLWPIIEKPRNESKKAFYVGCRGFAEGLEVFR